MTEPPAQIALSQELLDVLREAAAAALRFKEPFITSRTLLFALLDAPSVGNALARVVSRETLASLSFSADVANFDTLEFKTPDGSSGVWMSRSAYRVFAEGGKCAGTRVYLPHHLVQAIAADAARDPGILAALRVAPNALTDAVKMARPL